MFAYVIVYYMSLYRFLAVLFLCLYCFSSPYLESVQTTL